MRIRVAVHGLLTVAVKDPGGVLELGVAEGTDIQGLLEILHERSAVFDPRSTPIAVIEGEQVPLEHVLEAGQEVHLYPIFGGG